MASNPLRTLFWEATLRCNARCAFCGSRCGEHSVPALLAEELNTDEICSCLREIAGAYDPKTVMINVTGGEPLLRTDLFAVMEYAQSLGFPWGMVTNGSLIDASTVADMKRTGMRTISISLDGVPQTHNSIRRLPGGFEAIRNAVQLLKEADFLDELQITTVVSRQNLSELEALFAELCTWGIDTWRLATVDPIGRAEQQKELLLTDEDLHAYFAFFDAHQFNGKLTMLTSCSHYLGERDNLYRQHSFSCETGKTVGSILANGDIYVCPNVPRIPEWIQGNIRRDSFPAVWEQGFTWFRNPDRQKCGKCAACERFSACRGDSLHTWDFDEQKPKLCYLERMHPALNRDAEEQALKNRLLPHYPRMKGLRLSYGNSAEAKLLLTPSASRALLSYFEWGETTPRNRFELLAGLAGFIQGELIVVEQIIPGALEERNETTAAFSWQNYQELLKEIDVLNTDLQICGEQYHLSERYRFLGIAHTHPLELTAAPSIPDLELHGALQQKHGQFLSLLLNPQKKQIAAYYNSMFTPIDMELLVKSEKELEDF